MWSDYAANKYLHTVASSWIFINIEVTNTSQEYVASNRSDDTSKAGKVLQLNAEE